MIGFAARAPDLVFDLIQRHGIACEARRSGWIEGTPYASGMRAMEKRVASWRGRDEPVELLSATRWASSPVRRPTQVECSIAVAERSIRSPTIEDWRPQRSAVRRLPRRRGGARIVAGRRRLAGHDELRTAVGEQCDRRHQCLYGTPSAASALPGGLPLRRSSGDGPAGRPRAYPAAAPGLLRRAQALLSPRRGAPIDRWRAGSALATCQWTLAFIPLGQARLAETLPEIRDVPFEYHWYARGAAAADLLPHLYEPQAGLFAALGFAGRGIAMGTALGRALAGRVRGETAKNVGFPVTSARLPLGLSSIGR